MDAVTQVPAPVNEPVRQYAPGSAERTELESTLKRMASEPRELTMAIGGEHRFGSGDEIEVVQPHNRHHVLGTMRGARELRGLLQGSSDKRRLRRRSIARSARRMLRA
jgi:1-pyrroline-5-carboxylate dehydrogenase